ncbi:uncharacterized protein N7511_004106 [Penicillium nucicola]|uniref:uncharacterized protein n=1 Tax=Penicillium nucicola TaxID=1850975 RepID=UPI00254547F1|nr:uncharacterized protein N7511_004106 [Penicillium nucicola]KAJ5766490.1 hypothetical protein N7511_004106 [Penicillium nucicola]
MSAPNSGPGPRPSGDLDRKGSVKHARQLLEAGVRPERTSPSNQMRQQPLPRDISHRTQWPLPDSGLPPNPINHHPRYLLPQGPPPQRPPRPSEIPSRQSQIPSPSIYSERDGQESETSSNNAPRPPRSFSQLQPPPPLQPRRPVKAEPPVSPTSTVDMTPRISIATDDLFRQSTASSTASIPDMPPFPPPVPALEPNGSQDTFQRTAGLVAPPNARRPPRAPSAVAPIPEDLPDPRFTKGSFASSRAIPSSWGSGPPESEILGAYFDVESDEDADEDHTSLKEENATLVRSASLGKRGKPTMRTITKSNPVSVVSLTDVPSTPKENSNKAAVVGAGAAAGMATGAAANKMLRPPSNLRKASTSTASSDSLKGIDPEKPPFLLRDQHNSTYSVGLEKEIEVFGGDLPRAAPTMSDKRPGGRKPPALNMGALRDAEARGSLSSLSDLIRRATKLASNLDHGRTASRNDLAAGNEAGFKAAMGNGERRRRNSGSLSDILASFPPPGLQTPEGRGSWPVFFGRSNLRNVEQLHSNDDDPNAPKRKKTCCGIPRKIFVIICIVIFIIVILAILLPVFLVAVPREKANKDAACASINPCKNGGISVSSVSECSCVCSNGYTGSQCTVENDGSCTTHAIQSGTSTKNATMGSSLADLFDESKKKYDITLDAYTIMALFSMNNVSCKTENALVAFSDVKTTNSTGSNTRRSLDLFADSEKLRASPSLVNSSPTPVLAARAEATTNGILYLPEATTTGTATGTASGTAAGTATKISFQPSSTAETSTAPSTATATAVPANVLEFSQVAVLYILQKTGSLNTAMASGDHIEEYLTDSYTNATHPTMKEGAFTIDFENLTITLPNSTVAAQ